MRACSNDEDEDEDEDADDAMGSGGDGDAWRRARRALAAVLCIILWCGVDVMCSCLIDLLLAVYFHLLGCFHPPSTATATAKRALCC